MDGIRSILTRVRESKITEQEADIMYREYLQKHRAGVRSVYNERLRPVLIEERIDEYVLDEIDRLISAHDESKDYPEEFVAYRNYFYDKENHPRSSEEFNYAWNHHQKSNPHHWNYWVLIQDVDKPQFLALDMPLPYIIEMLADWQSAGAHYGNTAPEWYEEQKDKMILSEKTRNLVEKYLKYLS